MDELIKHLQHAITFYLYVHASSFMRAVRVRNVRGLRTRTSATAAAAAASRRRADARTKRVYSNINNNMLGECVHEPGVCVCVC